MNRLYCLLIVAGLLAIPAMVVSQIPRTLSYQGVLTDSLGIPKPDGSYTVTFSLYTLGSGGGSLWSEQKTLPIKRGLFSTVLGDQTLLPDSVRFDRPYWLGITVGIEPELLPRVPLSSVAYSLNSAKADSARYAMSAPLQASVDSARIAGTIPNNSVTSAMIQDGSITGSDINNGATLNVGSLTTTGSIGVGTASPSAALEVNGNIKVGYSDTYNVGAYPGLWWNSLTGSIGVGASNPVGLGLYAGSSTPRIFVANAGNVGIGTTSPAYKLDVNGVINATDFYENGSPFTGASQWATSGSDIYFNGGNVGIGATPAYTLDVSWNPPSNNINPVAVFKTTGASSSAGAIRFQNTSNNNFNIGITRDDAFAINYNSNISLSSDLLRITSAGNVGIGMIDPADKLVVGTGGNIVLIASGTTPNDPGDIIFQTAAGVQKARIWSAPGPSLGGQLLLSSKDNTPDITIDSSGNVGIGTQAPGYKLHVNGSVAGVGAYNNISDRRYKKNIVTLSNALGTVEKLRGVKYSWRQDEFPDLNFEKGKQLGFIAQEVKEVLPEVVTQDAKGYYSIAYSKLIPVLVEAMKEQQKQIEDLKAMVKSLAAKQGKGDGKSLGDLH